MYLSIIYRENFLQLDIFYKDMSYQEISQQPAFSLPSLLGEVGVFMGLLLGASIMTLCELLDYIVLNAIRVCRSKKRVNPISVNPVRVA